MWVAVKSSVLLLAPGTKAGSRIEGFFWRQRTASIYSFRSSLVREPHSFLTEIFLGEHCASIGFVIWGAAAKEGANPTVQGGLGAERAP